MTSGWLVVSALGKSGGRWRCWPRTAACWAAISLLGLAIPESLYPKDRIVVPRMSAAIDGDSTQAKGAGQQTAELHSCPTADTTTYVCEEGGLSSPSGGEPGEGPEAPGYGEGDGERIDGFGYLLRDFQALPRQDCEATWPPDTHGAVGLDHLVVMLNTEVRIQNRLGEELARGSLAGFWNGSPFDPKVFYDASVDRWIAVCAKGQRSASSKVGLAVSASGDPTVPWYRYEFDADPSDEDWADYPCVGFNGTWIAITANMFEIGGSRDYHGAKMWVVDKESVLAGGSALVNVFDTRFDRSCESSGRCRWSDTMVPCVTLTESPHLYIVDHPLWRVDDEATLRTSRIVGPVGDPEWEVVPFSIWPGTGAWRAPLDHYSELVDAPQAGVDTLVDTGDSRVMNAVYRDGRIWLTHAGKRGSGASERTNVFWYEIYAAQALDPVVQCGVLDAGAGIHYYYPSIAVNGVGDACLGYSWSDPEHFPRAHVRGRLAGDASGTMRPATLLKDGEAYYVLPGGDGRNRWGDYSATVVDPRNDRDFWTIQEYASTELSGCPHKAWGTWWGNVVLQLFEYTPLDERERGNGKGVAWGDYDADGDNDLYLVIDGGSDVLFENIGGGELQALPAGTIPDPGPGAAASWADYDNDGDLDLYLANPSGVNRLVRNDGGGWTDCTAGVLLEIATSQTGAWADYDRDGWLDLLVTTGTDARLLRNCRNGTFVAAVGSGSLRSVCDGAAWGDYDNDGFPDLYLTGTQGGGYLFRNLGGTGSFLQTDQAPGIAPSFGAAWGDYNNDGFLDLYVANEGASNCLWRNMGNGTFTLAADSVATMTTINRGVAWGDWDLDGNLDLCGASDGGRLVLLRNRLDVGPGGFEDASAAVAYTSYDLGRGVAWGDVDGDLDLDLYMSHGQDLMHWERSVLMVNGIDAIPGDRLAVRLNGTVSNRSGIGARVVAVVGDRRQVREVSASPGFYSQSAGEIVFGFGKSEVVVDTLEIQWPSGIVQRRYDVAAGGILALTELDSGLSTVALNDSLFVCPAGDAFSATPNQLEVTITLRDGDGIPLMGVPPELVSVYVSGISRYENEEITFCSSAGATVYGASDPTDEAGRTVIRDSTIGGCGFIYTDSIRVGAVVFVDRDTAEIRSPDFTGDGHVNFMDTARYAPELQSVCGLCGDLNYNGAECAPPPDGKRVNFQDTFKLTPHLNDGCSCPAPGKTEVVASSPPERSRTWGKPRIQLNATNVGLTGKNAGGDVVEATVVVDGVSPVSGIHFEVGFNPAIASVASTEVLGLYATDRVWGPYVHAEEGLIDVTVTTTKNGEVVSGDLVLARLVVNVTDGWEDAMWLESFHTADIGWNVDTLFEGAEAAGDAGMEFGVIGTVPNPFNPSAEIRFATGGRGRTSVVIYDVAGRRVRTLVDGETLEPGAHSVVWNGLSDTGKEAGSGIYFCRVIGPGGSDVQRMMLIR